MVIYGSAIPVSKVITEAFPPLLAAGLRVASITIVLSPVLVWRRGEIARMTRPEWLEVLGIALIGVVLFTVLLLLGMEMVPGVVGAIIISMVPAVTAIGSVILLREHIGWRTATGIALTVLGVLLVNTRGAQFAGQGEGNILLGSILVLGAVCSEAAHTLLGKVTMRKRSPILVVSLSAALATLLFAPFALYQAVGFDFTEVSSTTWLAVAWWGIGIMGLGTDLWYTGVAQVPGNVAAAFMGIIPISAVTLSYLLLGEDFQTIHLPAFGTVFAGVLFIAWSHAKSAKVEGGVRH